MPFFFRGSFHAGPEIWSKHGSACPVLTFSPSLVPWDPISVLQGALGKPAFLSAFTFRGRPSEEEKFLFAWRQMYLKFLCCKWVSRQWRLYARLAMPLAGTSVVRKSKEELPLMLQLESILMKLFTQVPPLTDKEIKAQRCCVSHRNPTQLSRPFEFPVSLQVLHVHLPLQICSSFTSCSTYKSAAHVEGFVWI